MADRVPQPGWPSSSRRSRPLSRNGRTEPSCVLTAQRRAHFCRPGTSLERFPGHQRPQRTGLTGTAVGQRQHLVLRDGRHVPNPMLLRPAGGAGHGSGCGVRPPGGSCTAHRRPVRARASGRPSSGWWPAGRPARPTRPARAVRCRPRRTRPESPDGRQCQSHNRGNDPPDVTSSEQPAGGTGVTSRPGSCPKSQDSCPTCGALGRPRSMDRLRS